MDRPTGSLYGSQTDFTAQLDWFQYDIFPNRIYRLWMVCNADYASKLLRIPIWWQINVNLWFFWRINASSAASSHAKLLQPFPSERSCEGYDGKRNEVDVQAKTDSHIRMGQWQGHKVRQLRNIRFWHPALSELFLAFPHQYIGRLKYTGVMYWPNPTDMRRPNTFVISVSVAVMLPVPALQLTKELSHVMQRPFSGVS